MRVNYIKITCACAVNDVYFSPWASYEIASLADIKERQEDINQMIYRVFSSQHKTDSNSTDTDKIYESVNKILHIFFIIKFRQKDAQKNTKVI